MPHNPYARRDHDDESSWSITSTALVLVLVVTLGTWVFGVDRFLGDDAARRAFLVRHDMTGRAPWQSARTSEAVEGVLGMLVFTGLIVGGIVLWAWIFHNGVFVGPRVMLMAFGITASSLVVMSILAFRAVIMLPYVLDILGFLLRERIVLVGGYAVIVGLIAAGAVGLNRVEEQRSRRRR